MARLLAITAFLLDLASADWRCGSSQQKNGKCESDHADGEYTHEEKLVYFLRFLERFAGFELNGNAGYMEMSDLIVPLSLVLQKVPEQSGPWIVVDAGANIGSFSDAIVHATKHGHLNGNRAKDYTDPWASLRSRRLDGIISIEPVSSAFSQLEAVSKTWPDDLPKQLVRAILRGVEGPDRMKITVFKNDTAWSSVEEDMFWGRSELQRYHQYVQDYISRNHSSSSGFGSASVSTAASASVAGAKIGGLSAKDFAVEEVTARSLADVVGMAVPAMGYSLARFQIFLLKIDCEFYDGVVLQGAIPLLRGRRALFVTFEQTEKVGKFIVNVCTNTIHIISKFEM